jgi:hypothetical protein
LIVLTRFVIEQNAMSRPIEIVVLTGFQGPEKGAKTHKTQKKSRWNEIEEDCHPGLLRPPVRRRRALSVTAIDEADMAIAAISGVTYPATAKGIATML